MRALLVLAILGASATAEPEGQHLVRFGHDAWTVTAPGAKLQSSRYNTTVVAKQWSIRIAAWPTSSVFVQTLDEELRAMRQRDPDLIVLQAERRAKSDWVLVVETRGKITGTVLRPGRIDNAMCSFDADKQGWQAPLAACRSLEHARRVRHS